MNEFDEIKKVIQKIDPTAMVYEKVKSETPYIEEWLFCDLLSFIVNYKNLTFYVIAQFDSVNEIKLKCHEAG